MKRIALTVCYFPVLLGVSCLILSGCGSSKLDKEGATALLDSIAVPETMSISIVSSANDEFIKLTDSRSERITGWRALQTDLENAGLITANLDERNESRQSSFFGRVGSEVWTTIRYSASLTPLGDSLILDNEMNNSLNGQTKYTGGKAIVGYWRMTGIDGIFQDKPEMAEIDAKYVFEKTPFYDICEQHSRKPSVKPYYLFEHLKFGVDSKAMNQLPKPNATKVIKYSAKKYEDGQWKCDLPPSSVKLAPSVNNSDEIEEIDLNPDGDVIATDDAIGIHDDPNYSSNASQPTPSNPKTATKGRFPIASERLLSISDLTGLTKADLKIMRNEIFARHGYIFKTPDMKSYFASQSWYQGRYENVTPSLTQVELDNVEFIKKHE